MGKSTERELAYSKRYYEKHREEILTRLRKHYHEDQNYRNKSNRLTREYAKTHRDQVRAAGRKDFKYYAGTATLQKPIIKVALTRIKPLINEP